MGAVVVTEHGLQTIDRDEKGEAEFNRRVRGPLRALCRRLRAYVFAIGLAQVLVAAMIAAAIQLGLDYTFRLPRDMRAALLAVIALAVVGVLWRRVWRPLRFPFGMRDVAALIERRHPGLHSLLVSAIQFAAGEQGPPEQCSPQLVSAVIGGAVAQAEAIRFGAVVRHGPVRRSSAVIIGVVLACLALSVLKPELVGMWFDRNVLLSNAQWPKRTRLVLEVPEGGFACARGDDLSVSARAWDELPRAVVVTYMSSSGDTGRDNMVAVGERGFRHTFSSVDEPFRFRLTGGDDQTEWYDVRLVERPAVESLTISIEPPAYTHLPRSVLPEGQRAVETLPGSLVALDATLNKPVVQSELARMGASGPTGDAIEAESTDPDGAAWRVTLSPTESADFEFSLVDEFGFANKHPTRVSIRVIKDKPPNARIKIEGISDIVTDHAVLPIAMSFSDAYGLADARLRYSRSGESGEPESVRLVEFRDGMTKLDTRLNWPIAPLGLDVGDTLSLWAWGRDYDDVSGPNEASSPAIVLRMVTPEEMLAELARREQEYRSEFERVIEQQEELRRDLLTLIGRLDEAGNAGDSSNRTAPLERRQRQVGAQVNLLRQQFEQILLELRINGLDTSTIRIRLDEGVVTPLTRLVRRDLVDATDLIRRFGQNPGEATGSAADEAQAALLEGMRFVLSNMLKWEGFHEAVTMLREIIRLQTDLNAETRSEIERRASEILGDG